MQQSPPPPDSLSSQASRLSPAMVGGAFCVLAALCYTASNFCMRQLTILGSPPMWAICNRETVTVAILGPWLVWQAIRGRRVLPSLKAIMVIGLVGLAVQLPGNLFSQWSMKVIGLSVNIPVIFGTMLLGSAILGRLLLGESVTRKTLSALGLLIAALALLGVSAGAARADAPATAQAGLATICLAVAGSACAGAVYAVFSITIRRAATGTTPSASMMVIVTGVGTLSLGLLSLHQLGPAALAATPPEHYLWMVAAGLGNLLGLMAITRGLQLTTVVHANMLNASQVAMAAMGGVWLFGESLSGWLLSGVGLTILGIILMNRPETPMDVEV